MKMNVYSDEMKIALFEKAMFYKHTEKVNREIAKEIREEGGDTEYADALEEVAYNMNTKYHVLRETFQTLDIYSEFLNYRREKNLQQGA